MLKTALFTIILVLLCVSGAYSGGGKSSFGDWKLVETDLSKESVILEHKDTGIQRTLYKGSEIDGFTVKRVNEDSIVITTEKARTKAWVPGECPHMESAQPVSQ